MGQRRVKTGFTLIELLVVVAVMAVLQALAAPAFPAMVDSARMTMAVNSLFSSLMLARSEAIKRNGRAVACKSADGEACAKTGGWEQGWIVFQDDNNNAALDAGEARLFRQQALHPSIRLVGNGPVAGYVSFNRDGATKYTSGAFQAGTLTACAMSMTNAEARQIVISSTGRVRTARSKLEHCP